MAYDSLRNASHEEAFQPSSSMTSDDNQVSPILFCRFQDGFIRLADRGHALYSDALYNVLLPAIISSSPNLKREMTKQLPL